MAGQLTFNQGTAGTHRKGMQETNAELLPSAALALNENRNIGLRYPLQLVSDSLHGRSLARR